MSKVISREQALDNAAAIIADAVTQQAAMTPRQQAEGAWYRGHPLGTVDAIEQAVIARRKRHAAILADRDRRATTQRTEAA